MTTEERALAIIVRLLGGGKAATYEWARKRGDWFYVMDIANALGVSPTHANNYARELTEIHLLDRERDDPTGGGRQFRYRDAFSSGSAGRSIA